MSKLIAPSLLAADPARLGAQIRAVAQAGADWLHVDVMDGHFVPNLTLGPPIIRGLRRVSALPFDVHLMVESPERLLADYVQAGANIVTVHVEACRSLYRTLTQIRALGAQAGVAVSPATPLVQLTHVLPMVDVVLVMTVEPGFGGQAFIPQMRDKVAELAAIKRAHNYPFILQVDGGITAQNIGSLGQAGAECFVAGSAIFRSGDCAEAISHLRRALRET